MNFAGKKAYLNKNKLENFISLKSVKESAEKPKLKRELSVKRIRDKSLDEEYSEDEENIDMVESLSSLPNTTGIRKIKTTSAKSSSGKKLFSVNSVKEGSIPKVARKHSISKHLKADNIEYEREVDFNVFNVEFNFLREKVGFATGDPNVCNECQAILNKFSVLQPIEGSDKCVWECEFCNYKNEIFIEAEEIPESESIDYFVQSKSQVDKNFKDSSFDDSGKIIFTFDTSGSMCVTTPITGKHNFKGRSNRLSEIEELKKFGDNSDQFYGGMSKNVTYISRLQCLQAAIESNLESMRKLTPNVKVGFVQFNNEVTCIGDGTGQPIKINGNNLNEYETIKALGKKGGEMIGKNITETSETLLKHLYSIEESGQTALGPAILYSINLINGVTKGSKIIICTDGLANIGLGALEQISNPEEHAKMSAFYEDLGEVAKEKGIIVSLLTFEGEESKIAILSKLVDKTGGSISRVKPSEILEEFANLLSTEIIATDVKLKVRLHKIVNFRNERESDLSYNRSTLTRNIGNATNESEVYIEYNFKPTEEISNYKDIDLLSVKSVPFQCIIEYTNKTGDRCIRVITQKLDVDSDKKEIEKDVDFNVISVNAIQQCSKLANEGDYRGSQAQAQAWKSVINNAKTSNKSAGEGYSIFKNNFTKLNNHLLESQETELNRRGEALDRKERVVLMEDKISSLASPFTNLSLNRAKKKK